MSTAVITEAKVPHYINGQWVESEPATNVDILQICRMSRSWQSIRPIAVDVVGYFGFCDDSGTHGNLPQRL